MKKYSLRQAPEQLSHGDLEEFEQRGFIAFKNVLSKTEVADLKAAMYDTCLNAVNGVELGSHILNTYHEGAYLRYVIENTDSRLAVQFEEGINPFDKSIQKLDVKYRKLMNFINSDDRFKKLAIHKTLLTYRDQLFGEDSILFQDMALSKPAKIGVSKPWHQDNAYFLSTPLDKVVGIWIAVDDATIENGCMQMIPTSREDIKAYEHIIGSDCEIAETDLDLVRKEYVEVPAGGAIFFYGMVPHYTAPNRSNHGRRALQLHYKGINNKDVSPEEYDQIFKTVEGQPAACPHIRGNK